jgi:hypothetical protein
MAAGLTRWQASSPVESGLTASGEVRPAERIEVEGDEATKGQHGDSPPHGPTVECAETAVPQVTVDPTRLHRPQNPQLSGAQPGISVSGRRALDHVLDVPRRSLAKRPWRSLGRRLH